MAQIDITGLFSDVLGSTQQQQTERELQRRDAEAQANLVGKLGGMAAYLAPQRSAALSSAAGGLLGLDTRTEADKLKEQLQSLGTPSTPEEHQRYADLLDKLRPGSGVQYMMSVAQERRAQEALDIDSERNEISRIQADAAAGQVELGEKQLKSLDEERLRLDAREEENREIEKLKIDADNAKTEAIKNQTSVTAIKLIEEAFNASEEAQTAGLEAKQIADDLARLSPTAGALGRFEEAKKSFFGDEDNVTNLRTRINKMTVNIVMDGLPPGAASDKDIELAQSTVPTSTMNPEMLESYFRGVAKISAINAYKERLKVDHLSANNGNLGGFIQKWEEAQKDPEFLNIIKKKAGYDWVTNDKELEKINKQSADNRAAAEAADKLAKEERAKGQEEKNRRAAGRRAETFNRMMSSGAIY